MKKYKGEQLNSFLGLDILLRRNIKGMLPNNTGDAKIGTGSNISVLRY